MLDQELNIFYIEAVHRLSALGAVVTQTGHGTSHEGFEAEWREVALFTIEGELINRTEVFDETDLDAAIARFDQLSRPAPRLENAASQVNERLLACFSAREWEAFAGILAEDITTEDRRRAVNAGVRQDRDAEIRDFRSAADLGVTHATSNTIATRGERLALTRSRYSHNVEDSAAFSADLLGIVEINADDRIEAWVTFDLDDIDDAIAELDARYLAGEAAAHAHTWSVVATAYAGFNRRELSASTPEWVSIDHRRGAGFAPGDINAYIQAAWDDSPDTKIYIDAVHRLSKIGAVVTHLARGISQEGFDAEWRDVHVLAVEGDVLSRSELFDEADLDAAIARFDELGRPAPRLENAASRASDRYFERVGARDWDAVAGELAVDYYTDDRRHIVGGAIHGRDAEIASVRVQADLGVTHVASTVIAVRGERLALSRVRYSGRNQESEAFVAEMLIVFEINADGRFAAAVAFDLDDFDAAIAELDARYLVGEAAAHGDTWSTLATAFATFNRHELPKLTPDWVNIDHRRGAAFATGDMTAYIRDLFDGAPDINIYIEVVHRLSELGAVLTQAAHGTSQRGFEAEWRESSIFTFDGDLISRCELFDRADLDAAIARFDELSGPATRLDNVASQVAARFVAHFATGDWDAMAELLADDFSGDDRRPVVSAGVRHGRDAQMANTRAIAELWSTNVTRSVIATRGKNLVLGRITFSRRDEGVEAFLTEVLMIVEINADEKLASIVTFDLEDFDTAIAELDARYLAGEAAVHARTWSVITASYEAMSRHELPAMTSDCASVDHRRATAFAPGELASYIHAGWDLDQPVRPHIEEVHRLNALGAVCTSATHGASRDGFDAEWRSIALTTVEGDEVNRLELFDEADLHGAIARFEELHPRERRLENAASHVYGRFQACFAARDWTALADITSDGCYSDDRRRVVNGGLIGRGDVIESFRSGADLGLTHATSDTIATRGGRLVLTRDRYWRGDENPEALSLDLLQIIEIDTEERIAALVTLDRDDFDAAIAELDARYLAGEAAAYSRTWSVIAGGHAALNRHELPPTTPDCVSIDHRRGAAFAPGDLIEYFRAGWELGQDIRTYVEVVHRLSDLGAVCTHAGHGVSHEGFDAEWHGVDLLTVEGDMVNRCEAFDDADLDAAIARFDQLSRPAPRLENTASQAIERYAAHFAARDWDALAKLLADDISVEDRRPVVNSGTRHGRDTEIANLQATADAGFMYITSVIIAARGERLILTRTPRATLAGLRNSYRMRWASSKSTLTIRSRRSSFSTSATSTAPSPNLTPDTSPAKRPLTRAPGR